MLAALAFLTPLPVSSRAPSGRTFLWFPIVGALLGGVLGLLWRGLYEVTSGQGFLVACILVVADLALTGALHFDGLVDSADGLLPPLDRVRRLDVMADPSAGAFGVGAAATVLLLRWASLAALAPSAPLLCALWCASRLAMAGFTRSVPYARAGGLATAFRQSGRWRLPLGGILLGSVLVGLGGGDAVAGVAVLALASAAVVALAVRRVGGFTGDVLGAAGIVGETLGLLAAAARW